MHLTELEVVAGTVFGAGSPVRFGAGGREPGAALRQACLDALSRPPCMVSFSGGGDSSAVLAAATAAARVHGLADPIPVSLRFPGVASTEESEWQEAVIAHLRLEDWIRVEVSEQLDFLGEVATQGLERHGLLWPANAHFHVPVFERARGGTVLTGLEGDGLLGGWRWQRAQAVLARRVHPVPRDVLRIPLALAPPPIRAAAIGRRLSLPSPWLRPSARRRLARAVGRELAGEPRSWGDRVAWFARRRYLQVGLRSLALLAAEHDVELRHPLLDPGFLSALAVQGGEAGYGTRLEARRALFGDLLPPEVLKRRTKAEFGPALWGPEARAFAARWDGRGVDPELVDPDELRRTWSQENPPLAAATVLQHAWLASR